MKNKQKKVPILESFRYTLSEINKGDPLIVWFSFYKNTTEGIFNALFAIYVIKYIYECIEKGINYKKLVIMVTAFCGVHIMLHITSVIHAYYQNISEMKVYKYIFEKVMHKAKRISVMEYESPEFYDNFSRALDEALERGFYGMLNVTWTFQRIAGCLVAVVVLFTVDPWLILFAVPPIIGSFAFGLKESSQRFLIRQDETYGKRKMEYAKRVFYEKRYAGELRLYPITEILFRQHKEGYEERYQANKAHQGKLIAYRAIQTLLFAGIVTLCSYLYITYCIKLRGVNAVGAYIAMISAISYITNIINDGVRYFSDAGKYCAFMLNFRDFMKCQLEEAPKDAIAPTNTMGDIQFKHVNFHYLGSEQMIIKDLSMNIRQGEHIALVGENGAGKTTLMKLLMGLYPISGGDIVVGGNSVSSYDMEKYRDCFGTVFQDFQIFSLSLVENVLLHKPKDEADEKLAIESLQHAQFGDVLEKLPQGIQTQLTKEFDPEGFVCSGGQAQKVAIARVFAKNPEVIILDEPSSALDPIAEYNMYQNMMEVAKGKTVFFISHRMSSARMADRILFLENGRIVEQGTHEELIQKNGHYAKMFHLQAQSYQEEMGGGLYEAE